MLSYDDLNARRDAPAGSTWGLFGDNELGMVNVLTEARVLAGTACVRSGEVINLDLPLDAFDPSLTSTRQAPVHEIFASNPNGRDDLLNGFYLQGTTQIDGLRHFRHPDFGFYNGVSDADIRVGTPSLGVQHWAEHGLVGRGVLLDVERFLASGGVTVDQSRAWMITADVLDETAAAQGVEVQSGDMVLFRTGWLRYALEEMDPERRAAFPTTIVSPGLAQDEAVLRWLWEHQVPLVAADNFAVEAYPPVVTDELMTESERDGAAAGPHTGMLHRILIPLMGIVLGELWTLDALANRCASDGRWDFLLSSKPLNLVGGVGSPANAMAIR